MDSNHANNQTVTIKLSARTLTMITALEYAKGYDHKKLSTLLRSWIEDRVNAEYKIANK